MSFFSDLADGLSALGDKYIDYKEAETGGFIGTANAAEPVTTADPVAPIVQSPLGFDIQRALPFIVVGGVAVVAAVLLTR